MSIQEAVYRILSLDMTRCSVKVKYIATNHPEYRLGLVKNNLDELGENENIFNKSIHDHYAGRPLGENNEQKEEWSKMCLAELK